MTQQFEILDDRVLVQMHLSTPIEGELYLPKFDTYATEDGRTKTRLSDDTYLSVGQVLQVGLKYVGPLKPNDEVYISYPSLHKYYFNPDSLPSYTGLVLVPQSLIDARLTRTGD